MSLPEAIIAKKLRNSKLSLTESFDLYLDYITESLGKERFASVVDPNEHTLAQVLTAFRRWFSSGSKESQELMDNLQWNPREAAINIAYNLVDVSKIYSCITGPLISVGETYYDFIVETQPEGTVYPHGGTLLDYSYCLANCKNLPYFHLKLAVELDANILHSRRNADAPCHIQVEDAWNEDDMGKFKLFLEFVDRECLADYMGVFDPAVPA